MIQCICIHSLKLNTYCFGNLNVQFHFFLSVLNLEIEIIPRFSFQILLFYSVCICTFNFISNFPNRPLPNFGLVTEIPFLFLCIWTCNFLSFQFSVNFDHFIILCWISLFKHTRIQVLNLFRIVIDSSFLHHFEKLFNVF